MAAAAAPDAARPTRTIAIARAAHRDDVSLEVVNFIDGDAVTPELEVWDERPRCTDRTTRGCAPSSRDGSWAWTVRARCRRSPGRRSPSSGSCCPAAPDRARTRRE